jgi:hypothetical protein
MGTFSLAVVDKQIAQNPCREVKPLGGEQARVRHFVFGRRKAIDGCIDRRSRAST